MKLKVERKYLKEDYTVGNLYIDYEKGNGWEFFCNTLEDKVRDFNKDGDLDDSGETKVYGKTAIPYGKYQFTLAFSPHFKRELPLLMKVKGFSGIMIHGGTTAEDSLGCILIGLNKAKGKLLECQFHLNKLIDILKENKQVLYEIEVV